MSGEGILLSQIPLVLLYPTLLLSNNLILTIHDDILDLSDDQVPRIIQYFILPLFASSLVTFLLQLVRIFENNALTFLVSFTILVLNSFLGPIEASTVSILFLQLLTAKHYNILPYAILPLLSIGIDYYDETLSYATILSYFIISAILVYKNRSKKSSQLLDGLLVSKFAMAILSFVCIIIIYLWISLTAENEDNATKMNFSMLFVFLGCAFILLLVCHDVKSTMGGESFVQVWQNHYAAPIVGLMALALKYMSFNAIASSKMSDFLTIMYIIAGGVLPKHLDYYSSNLKTSKEEDHKHCTIHSHNHLSPSSDVNEPEFFSTSSLLLSLATNKETKSIFSFFLLNTAFMFVQLLYSFRSKSLGLLSDSLHMALDCVSLFLGLLAGVLSKRKETDTFPFSLKYLETVAGFTNGVLLIGIVVEIFIESIQRLFNPVTILATTELLVVSVLGLLVNVVGLFAFDHGHDHDHDSNDNMRGIFLHILADTLGSVGVIISTLLTKAFGLQIFDPVASFLIATLILLSSIPLLKSTGASILLALDDKKHNLLKDTLNQIASTPGITGYTTPRFWPETPSGNSHSHSHSHSHVHSHEHSHAPSADHSDSHSHKHSNSDCSLSVPQKIPPKKHVLVGYIHVQYAEGENSTIIKKRVEKVFSDAGIKAWIQVEPQNSTCWCRATSMIDQAAI